MTPLTALGGIQFHAESSKGMMARLIDELKSDGYDVKALEAVAKISNEAYQKAFRTVKRMVEADELEVIKKRQAELESGK